jgi:hypothetical protein
MLNIHDNLHRAFNWYVPHGGMKDSALSFEMHIGAIKVDPCIREHFRKVYYGSMNDTSRAYAHILEHLRSPIVRSLDACGHHQWI